MNSQLVKEKGTSYEKVYPLAYIQGIMDADTGEHLSDILSRYNHVYIPWQGSQESTRLAVPRLLRKEGLWISYNYNNSSYSEWFTKSSEDAKIDIIWKDSSNWERVPDKQYVDDASQRIPSGSILPEMLSPALQEFLSEHHTITNIPDDEDLASFGNVIRFKDRLYKPNLYSGKGYKILRKNWVCSKNILTQSMLKETNTIYEIRYNYDLNGETVRVPDGCILYFKGGTISNGVLLLNNTYIIPSSSIIEDNILAEVQGTYLEGQINYDKTANIIKWYSKGKWFTFNGIKSGPTSERPNLGSSENSIQFYYDTTIKSLIYWNLKEWIDVRDGYYADFLRLGSSSERPTLNSSYEGFKYFDSDLKSYIIWNGNEWEDLNGYTPGERNSDGTLIDKVIII